MSVNLGDSGDDDSTPENQNEGQAHPQVAEQPQPPAPVPAPPPVSRPASVTTALRQPQLQPQQQQQEPAAAPKKPFSQSSINMTQFDSQNPNSRILANLRAANPRALAPSADSEKIRLLTEHIKELQETEELRNDYELKAIPVTQADMSSLAVASVILAVRRAGVKDVLGFHVLLLADTVRFTEGRVPSLFANIGGRNVEIIRTVGDAYDDKYRMLVAQTLQRHFPDVPPAKMFNADCEVLPQGYDYKSAHQVRETLLNALDAATTILNSRMSDFKDFTLTDETRALTTQATLLVNQAQSVDAVGHPVRSDVQVDLASFSNNNRDMSQQVSLNTDNQNETLFRVKGFMDLVWNPTAPVAQANPWVTAVQPQAAVQNPLTQLYSARYVITDVFAAEFKTLPQILFALTSLMVLQDNYNWIGAFWNPNRPSNDTHDIGSIGYEALSQNGVAGKPVDTSSNNFSQNDLAQLMRAFVQPKLSISMDAQEAGPNTWVLAPFAAAANGDLEAIAEIETAAMLMTNGAFGQYWAKAQNKTIASSDRNRIELGYYHAANTGEMRDVRDIDYLTVLGKLAPKNLEFARDWSETHVRIDHPIELRQQSRRALISEVLQGADVKYTGFAQRITLGGEFLEALALGVSACGVKIAPQTPFTPIGAAPRAVAEWLNQSALSGNGGQVLQRGFGGQQQTGNAGFTGFGRYGVR